MNLLFALTAVALARPKEFTKESPTSLQCDGYCSDQPMKKITTENLKVHIIECIETLSSTKASFQDYHQIRPWISFLTFCDIAGECSCVGIPEQADLIIQQMSADKDAVCGGVCRGKHVNPSPAAFKDCIASTKEKKTRAFITSQFYLRGRCSQAVTTALEDVIMQSIEL